MSASHQDDESKNEKIAQIKTESENNVQYDLDPSGWLISTANQQLQLTICRHEIVKYKSSKKKRRSAYFPGIESVERPTCFEQIISSSEWEAKVIVINNEILNWWTPGNRIKKASYLLGTVCLLLPCLVLYCAMDEVGYLCFVNRKRSQISEKLRPICQRVSDDRLTWSVRWVPEQDSPFGPRQSSTKMHKQKSQGGNSSKRLEIIVEINGVANNQLPISDIPPNADVSPVIMPTSMVHNEIVEEDFNAEEFEDKLDTAESDNELEFMLSVAQEFSNNSHSHNNIPHLIIPSFQTEDNQLLLLRSPEYTDRFTIDPSNNKLIARRNSRPGSGSSRVSPLEVFAIEDSLLLTSSVEKNQLEFSSSVGMMPNTHFVAVVPMEIHR